MDKRKKVAVQERYDAILENAVICYAIWDISCQILEDMESQYSFLKAYSEQMKNQESLAKRTFLIYSFARNRRFRQIGTTGGQYDGSGNYTS